MKGPRQRNSILDEDEKSKIELKEDSRGREIKVAKEKANKFPTFSLRVNMTNM